MKDIARSDLLLKDTGLYKRGGGVFAGRNIFRGQVIHHLDGEVVTLRKVVDRILAGTEAADDPLQIGRRTYLDLDAFSRSFNHACCPNAGLRKRSELIALRDIGVGEHITYDYSATIAPTFWEMSCACGESNCRRMIGDVRSIPEAKLQAYLACGAIQSYMRPILKALSAGTYAVPRYEVIAMERLGALQAHPV